MTSETAKNTGRGIGTGRTIAPKSGVSAGVAMLPRHSSDTKRVAKGKSQDSCVGKCTVAWKMHSCVDCPWTAFQLLSGDFEQLFAVLKADELLWGFVGDKVRY
jgi:hypothetical protein